MLPYLWTTIQLTESFIELCDGHLTPSIDYPIETGKKIFLLFDPTHNIKNIFNSFEKRGVFSFPSESILQCKGADFKDLDALVQHELIKLLKIAHKLCPSLLHPNSIKECPLNTLLESIRSRQQRH